MHLTRLCMILPADSDEVQVRPFGKSYVKKQEDVEVFKFTPVKEQDPEKDQTSRPKRHGRARRILRRVLDSKVMHLCDHGQRKQWRSGALFEDTAGVDLSDKVVGGSNPRIFSFSELYIGTNGFSQDGVLGSGGFGKVYKAVLPSDGTAVAVKCVMEKGERFEKSFAAELVAVAHLRHRNLVRLRGWCVHEEQLLLVYDYMPNRSLDRVLFRKPHSSELGTVLSWNRRRKIVSGLAAGLFYIHEQLETQIIHRDVKTSNVMLDSHFNARLGDFGLARWLEHDDPEYETRTPSMRNRQFRLAETTRIGGTIGYLPPESFQKRYVATAKSDVFSFGVVVLEVVSGRRAVDLTFPDDQIILLDWMRKLSDQRMLLQAADTRLPDGSYGLADLVTLIHVGLLCTLHEPQSRPNMKWVVEALSGNLSGELPDLPSFQSHPLYVSLSSSSDSSSTSTSRNKLTDSSSSTSIAKSISSRYATAKGETIYQTADFDTNDPVSTPRSSQKPLAPNRLPMFETPREISYKEIISATDDFSEANRVAELDFGTAYHGILDNSHHVLIKRLNMKTCPALRVRFANELRNLGRLRHRNLVQLRGWCTEQGEMLVVYDYLPNRLLSHILLHHHEPEKSHNALSWYHRYNIIKSLASAILYLHEEWDEQVIHKNITSSAIVLEPDMNPRLTGFALAEFLIRNENGHHVVIDTSRSACGIFGYMSPEYVESGTATTTADVYSFGVVVLETLTGHIAVDFRTPEVLLVKRVREFEAMKRPLEELADWRLDGNYDQKEMMRLVKLGIACTRSDPEQRPSMRQIVRILDGNDEWLMSKGQKKETMEDWNHTNETSLSLIRRIQALGIQ
uniref:Protein kinase domain-containing protein n=1 Tax=Kalanchoe fedtschenkoi TaxID=63787 RepID=A0A7N0V512_KALFE